MNILRSAIISSSVGVRQGAPTSCLLFVLYIDKMVKIIKNSIESDGFLGALHVLLLMDDAVILATSREMCERKLKIVLEYCDEYGMVINEKKTKFFVLNKDEADKQDLVVNNVTVNYTNRYLYLGAWFTDTGKTDDVLRLHEPSNEAAINKFSIFCTANTQMPFVYKKKVFDAAITSAMLYSCETWLTNKFKGLERQYHKLIRCLLGVRKNTSMNLCMIETGISPLLETVKYRRANFIKSKLRNIDMNEPFHFVYNMCRVANTPGFRYLNESLNYQYENPLEKISSFVSRKANEGNATKFATYINDLNPDMTVHPVYTCKEFIPDYKRMAFTRLRLMSHNLRIETGRWSRIPRDHRVCLCNNTNVQNEHHVLLDCSLTIHCREKYISLNYENVSDLLKENVETYELCNFIFDVLNIYA